LLWQAIEDGRLTLDGLVQRMDTQPRKIFGITASPETSIEVELGTTWEVRARELQTKCGWTPYEGMRLPARVRRTTLRGRLAYDDGRVLAPPGSGHDLAPGAKSADEGS
jgi:carbamoyl-phosphate synthase/aspartate carbamoyltransferase/dihydroorotase